jgi:hypothetical protein
MSSIVEDQAKNLAVDKLGFSETDFKIAWDAGVLLVMLETGNVGLAKFLDLDLFGKSNSNSFTFDLCRSAPFNVKLAIAETTLRLEIATTLDYRERTFGDAPFRRAAIRVLPLREILSVEKHNRVRGGSSAYTWNNYAGHRFPNLRELWVSLGLLPLSGIDERRH